MNRFSATANSDPLPLALFTAELTAPVQATVAQPWTDGRAAVSGRVASMFNSGVTSSWAVILDRASGFGVQIAAGGPSSFRMYWRGIGPLP